AIAYASFDHDFAVSKDLHDGRLSPHDTPITGPSYTTPVDATHHIVDAAVRELRGYNRDDAPAILLEVPSRVRGTQHYYATQVQRRPGGGTLGAELRIAYGALIAADVPAEVAFEVVERAKRYFYDKL